MDFKRAADLHRRALRALGREDLELALDESWAATTQDFRKTLRASLQSRLPGETLTDLKSIPRSSTHSISVSHCRLLGGYALLPLPARVGFDIEEAARVKQPIVARVTHESDETPPSPAHLWVAKEAVFKCLFLGHQPITSTQISIHGWKRLTPTDFLFAARRTDSAPNPEGYGTVLESGPLLLCFFIDHSQLTSSASDRQYVSRK